MKTLLKACKEFNTYFIHNLTNVQRVKIILTCILVITSTLFLVNCFVYIQWFAIKTILLINNKSDTIDISFFSLSFENIPPEINTVLYCYSVLCSIIFCIVILLICRKHDKEKEEIW